jgi:diaminopimelate decarboxylase
MRDLDYKNNVLFFEGVSTIDVAKQYHTPLYVYSQHKIEDKIEEIKNVFLHKYPSTYAFYASKAFLNLEMARIIKDSVLGMDVASMGECFIALKAGIEPHRILYHGNNKSIEELQYIVEHKIGRVVVDNLDELEQLCLITNEQQNPLPILIRFSPQLHQILTHKNIQTGHKASKFGFDLNHELEQVASIISTHSSIDFRGFHFHVGSQLFTNQHHLEAIDEVFEYIRILKEQYDIITTELNIGGGFGIYYNKNDKPLSLSTFIDPSMKKIQQLSARHNLKMPSVLIEPGRFIVGEAAITLYEVGSIKKRNNKVIASVHGGMTDNLRVALYDGIYEASPSYIREGSKQTYTIVGNVCESTDVMIKDITLSPLEPCDFLTVFSTGAYEQSLSNNFNKMLRPAIVMIKDGKPRLIQRRETNQDLIARDI